MNKINISASEAQTATCEELDAIAHDYLSIQTTLDDESYGCRAGATLSLPTTITASDGVYNDTKEALADMGVTVNGTEYVRIIWHDEAFKSAMLSAYPILEDKITTTQLQTITDLPNINGMSIKTLYDLKYFKHLTRMSPSNARYCGSLSSLTDGCFKYIKYVGMSFLLDSGSIKRTVFPSFIFNDGQYYHGGNVLSDFGPNTQSFSSNTCNWISPIFILRNTSSVPSVASWHYKPTKIFVLYSMLSAFKASSSWSSLSSIIYPIGGPTWQDTFAANAASRSIDASSPYADMSDEEQSWYDDLFPDLYKDWVAPTSDE